MAFVCRYAKYLKPPGLASLCDQFACLPDERHITGPRCGTAIMDKDRVYAGHPDVHLVEEVDGHDVGSCCATESLGDGRPGIRFQAHPLHAGAGNMLQTHLTYSSNRGAGAHDQHRSV